MRYVGHDFSKEDMKPDPEAKRLEGLFATTSARSVIKMFKVFCHPPVDHKIYFRCIALTMLSQTKMLFGVHLKRSVSILEIAKKGILSTPAIVHLVCRVTPAEKPIVLSYYIEASSCNE